MTRPNPDWNLVFCALAVQLEFVTPESVSKAMDTWRDDKSKRIDDLLVEHTALEEGVRDLLVQLVDRHIEAHGNETRRSLKSLASLGSVQTTVAGIDESKVSSGVSEGIRRDREQASTTSLGSDLSRGNQRYSILRPHAKGGIGQVFVAEDAEFRREVALKELQSRYRDDADNRARFLREAEITGGLEHPGIVPVYSLGRHTDGRPYYAMKLIRGQNLQQAIEAYHREHRRDVDHAASSTAHTGRVVAFRRLLRRMVDVCNAVSYAHGRGVLHRDIKPSNIMLGRHGETLVVDWGLAKPLQDPCSSAMTLAAGTGGDSSATRMGSVIGTPQYMSPEQAEGRLDELDPRTDVYSIGATLYALLVGEHPFSDTSGDRNLGRHEVLQRVRHGDFRPPRSINPRVPRALDAVCRKAMALAPTDRYETAEELAADLEHFLADEPVMAYSEPITGTVLRWGRRHRSWVAASAIGMIAITLISSLAAVSIQAARGREAWAADELSRQLVETERQRSRAERNFGQARKAVNTYLSSISESKLLNVPRLRPLRRELLEAALDFHLWFVGQRRDDSTVRAELADSYRYVARIRSDLGDLAGSEAAWREAITIYEQLCELRPAETVYQDGLADTLHNLAMVQDDTGETKDASVNLKRAFEIRSELVTRFADTPQFVAELAKHHVLQGNLSLQRGDHEDARQNYVAAVEMIDRIVQSHGDLPYRGELMTALVQLAGLEAQLHQFNEAKRALLRAIEIGRSMAVTNQDHARDRELLAGAYSRLGALEQDTGSHAAAADAYARSIEIRDRLVNDYPAVPEYHEELAIGNHNRGILLDEIGQPRRAAECFEKAIASRRRLVAMYPEVVEYRSTLAGSCNSLGIIAVKLSDYERAHRLQSEAESVQRQLVEKNPESVIMKRDLAVFLHGLGTTKDYLGRPREAMMLFKEESALMVDLVRTSSLPDDQNRLASSYVSQSLIAQKLGDPANAIVHLHDALKIRERLASSHPDSVKLQRRLAGTMHRLGQLYHQRGELDNAFQQYRDSAEITRKLVQGDPAWIEVHVELGGALCNAAIISGERDDFDGADRLFEEAIKVLESAVGRAPNDQQGRQFLFNTRRAQASMLARRSLHSEAIPHWRRAVELSNQNDMIRIELARSLLEAGQHDATVREIDAIIKSHPTSAKTLYDAAGLLALASGRPAEGNEVQDSSRQKQSDTYANQAIEYLQQAKTAGFFEATDHVQLIESDRQFEAIRQRELFNRFLRSIQLDSR